MDLKDQAQPAESPAEPPKMPVGLIPQLEAIIGAQLSDAAKQLVESAVIRAVAISAQETLNAVAASSTAVQSALVETSGMIERLRDDVSEHVLAGALKD